MAIVGLNITKINAERKEPKGGKVNINNNISIASVETKDLSLGKSKQKGLKFAMMPLLKNLKRGKLILMFYWLLKNLCPNWCLLPESWGQRA